MAVENASDKAKFIDLLFTEPSVIYRVGVTFAQVEQLSGALPRRGVCIGANVHYHIGELT